MECQDSSFAAHKVAKASKPLPPGAPKAAAATERRSEPREGRQKEDLSEEQSEAQLKGSIGEGPNHSNFSDQSSVRIQEILLEFVRNCKKFRNATECSTFSRICGEILRNFHEHLSKIQSKLLENIKSFQKFCRKMRKSLTKF